MDTTSESGVEGGGKPGRRRGWRFQIRLRTWLVIMVGVGLVCARYYRRYPITRGNTEALVEVARLDKGVFQIAWSPERDRVALVEWEKPVEIRDAVSLRLIETVGEGRKLINFAFGADPNVVGFCVGGTSKKAEILDRRTGRTIVLDCGNDQPNTVFNPDGRNVATGGYGTVVKLWRIADGALIREFDAGPMPGALTPAFSRDGSILAVGNRNSVTHVFDTRTGERLFTLPKASTQQIQFSPDGKTLAVAYVDGTLRLWDAGDGRLKAERKTSAEELYAVDWSPDGKMLASSGLRGRITLWDPSDLSIVRELPSPEWVIGVRFSPDGLGLVSAGGKGGLGGKQSLTIWGVEGALYSLLHRRR